MKKSPANSILVSYIIPALNAHETISLCLESIRNQNFKGATEIIVVDNGSIQPLGPLVRKFGAILLKESVAGASHARNRGVNAARGKYLAFLDADVALAANWTSACVERLSRPWVDCVQAPIYPQSLKALSLMRWWRHSFIYAKTGGTFNYLNTATHALPAVNSAAFMIKRSRYRAMKVKFDESLLRCEDLDLTYQLFFKGCHFATVPMSYARAYDSRKASQYLLRSFANGFYTAKVREQWLEPAVDQSATPRRRQLFQNRIWEPTAAAFGFANRIASVAGEQAFARQPSINENRKRKLRQNIKEDQRNSFLLRMSVHCLGGTQRMHLSPYARITLLDNSIVLFDVSQAKRIELSLSETNAFLELIGTDIQNERVIRLKDNTPISKLTEKMMKQNFLIAQKEH